MFLLLRLKKFFRYTERKQLSTMLSIFLITSVFFGSYMYFGEKLSLIDTLYYLTTTASTIGYGDISPKTTVGKTIYIFYVVLAIATFAAILNYISEKVAKEFEKVKKGKIKMKQTVKLMVIGFPNEDKVREIVEQIRNDIRFKTGAIVVVSNDLQEKPIWFDELNVKFVKGVTSDINTLLAAGILETENAIVLAQDPTSIESDEKTVSVIAVLEKLNPSINTIAERVRQDSMLFSIVGCNVISRVTNPEVLAREVLDAGAIEFENAIFSAEVPGTQFNFVLKEDTVWATLAYDLICKGLIPEGYRLPDASSFILLPQPADVVLAGSLVKYRGSSRI